MKDLVVPVGACVVADEVVNGSCRFMQRWERSSGQLLRKLTLSSGTDAAKRYKRVDWAIAVIWKMLMTP